MQDHLLTHIDLLQSISYQWELCGPWIVVSVKQNHPLQQDTILQGGRGVAPLRPMGTSVILRMQRRWLGRGLLGPYYALESCHKSHKEGYVTLHPIVGNTIYL